MQQLRHAVKAVVGEGARCKHVVRARGDGIILLPHAGISHLP